MNWLTTPAHHRWLEAETDRLLTFGARSKDPLGGFVITGNNTAGNGPPIFSDADYASLCLTNSPPGFQPTRGIKWLYGAPGHSMYNHRRPPNDKRYDCRGGLPHSDKSSADWRNLSLNVAARSRHSGGVNQLFCDGHVEPRKLGTVVAKDICLNAP